MSWGVVLAIAMSVASAVMATASVILTVRTSRREQARRAAVLQPDGTVRHLGDRPSSKM